MTQPLLENFICPKCQCSRDFYVDVLATVHVSEAAPCLAGDYFADGDFTCICLSCDHEGRVFEFTKATEVRS